MDIQLQDHKVKLDVALCVFKVVEPFFVCVFILFGKALYHVGIVISMLVGGEVSLLRNIEEGCGLIIEEMPIQVRCKSLHT